MCVCVRACVRVCDVLCIHVVCLHYSMVMLVFKLITIVVNFGRFPAMMNCPKLGIPLNGTFRSVNITYSIIAKE